MLSDDYAEVLDSPQPRRWGKGVGPRQKPLPVYDKAMLQTSLHVPMQKYLVDRFAFTGKRNDPMYKRLRAENQRRHDLAAARGNWKMNRTS